MKTAPVYDCAVVGGGIAGLAMAELFARAGERVILLERNDKLCQEASAAQHGWFHFGSLYSIFPQNQFLRTMVGGVEDLLAYYRGFEGLNISVEQGGRLAFRESANAWFRDEPIEYIVSARNDPDFDMRTFGGVRDYGRKAFFLLTWEAAIKQFISRHQRFHKHDWSGPVPASQWIPRAGWMDYSRDVITKPAPSQINIDRDTHFRIVGFDRPMRATAIITDLVRGLLGSSGEIKVSTEVVRYEQDGDARRLILADGGEVRAKRVVLAAAKWLGDLLPRADSVKVVASPLLVAYPAVADTNFVRMTPFVERSVNHLHHTVDGRRYSLIGGGYFADPRDPAAVERASQRLIEMARSVFPRLAEATTIETYLGYKTEITAERGERNYQYFIREVENGVHVVVPGKFSLSFSMAVNAYKRIADAEPPMNVKLAPLDQALPYIGLTRHAGIVARGSASPATSISLHTAPNPSVAI